MQWRFSIGKNKHLCHLKSFRQTFNSFLLFIFIIIDLFNLIGNDNGRADERRLGLLIYDCLRLPKLLGEVAAFGGTNIEPSIRSCLEMAGQPLDGGAGVASVCAQDVLNWVRAEPQSLVWLLVLHRLRLAERSRHPAKCNLCRCYPIVGFRYRCLKCFNFDLCQECFLCDMATKKHKSSYVYFLANFRLIID